MTTVLRRTIQGQRVTLRSYPNVGASRVWEVQDEAGTILGTVRRFYPFQWWACSRRYEQSSETRDGAVALLLQAVRTP